MRKTLLVACFLFLSIPAHAQSSKNLEIDPSTGTVITTVPITLPPGRHGVEPNLTLMYNSSSPNGILGNGWMLDLGSIQRSTKHGVPTYDNTIDSFVFTQSGSQNELTDIGSGLFRAKIEENFIKIQFVAGTYWVATDKKGTKYYFGSSISTRETNPGNTAYVFKWCLDRVEDILGNYMSLTYVKDSNNYIYIDEIKYTGHTGSTNVNPPINVKFNYQGRSGSDLFRNYLPGFLVIVSQRLANITISVEEQTYASYGLTYSLDSENQRSLLTKVTKFAYDGTSLPSIIYTYSNHVPDFKTVTSIATAPNKQFGLDSLIRLMDMNNDGYPDILETFTNPSATTQYQIWINNKAGNFNAPIIAKNSPHFANDDPNNIRFEDLDGDGLLDAISGTACPYWVSLNNGQDGFDAAFQITTCPSGLPVGQLQFVDMNGDGFVDMLDTRPPYKIYFNNDLGDFTNVTTAINAPSKSMNGNMQFSDFNGDGLPDLIDSGAYDIYINNGQNGFEQFHNAQRFPSYVLSSGLVRLVDITGDGLTDLVYFNPSDSKYYSYVNDGHVQFNNGAALYNSPSLSLTDVNSQFIDFNDDGLIDCLIGSGSNWKIYLNNGQDGFLTALPLINHPNNLNDVVIADANADGLLDLISSDQLWLNSAGSSSAKPGVLIAIDNSVGLKTTLKYKAVNTQIPGFGYSVAMSPYLFNSLQSVTYTIANGGNFTTTYIYKNPKWVNREFRGFGYGKISDGQNYYSETYYQQDDIAKGKMQSQLLYDSSGTLLFKTVNAWVYKNIFPDVNFPYISKKDTYNYKANKRTQSAQSFDTYGNLLQATDYGEVNFSTGADVSTSDNRIKSFTYSNNSTTWLIGLPLTIVDKNSSGTVLKQGNFIYDAFGQLISKADENGTTDPLTKYTYDEFGNVKTTTDPKGNVLSTTYDSKYFIFPVSIKNSAFGLEVKNDIYGVTTPLNNGDGYEGLWGQLKTTTDPNNNKGMISYTASGQEEFNVSSQDSVAYPTSLFFVAYTSSYTKRTIQNRRDHGVAGTLSSYDFIDGAGRIIQIKRPSEVSGKYIVSNQVQYNSRGLVDKSFLPYFSANTLDTIEPIDLTKAYVSYQYDALGRATKTINPDGTYSTRSYDGWTITAIDENGHQKKYSYNAFGNLIKAEEFTGADGRSIFYPKVNFLLYATTNYSYDLLGNLVKITDNDSNVIQMTYNQLGQKSNITDPDMGYWQYSYDLAGNLDHQIDAKNKNIDFNYDVMSRLTNKTDGLMSVIYTHDDPTVINSKGHLTKSSYGADNSAFSFDTLGLDIKTIKKINSVSYVVQRTFNAVNNLSSIKYPDGFLLNYTFNLSGNIETVSSPGNGPGSGAVTFVSAIDYTPSGQIAKIIYGNGVSTTYSYNSNLRLIKLLSVKGSNTIQDFLYEYDSVGNITKITDNENTASQTFYYDGQDRIIKAINSTTYGTKYYAYDEIGNIIKKDNLIYTYDPANKPHAVRSLGDGTTFQYDANGNMVEQKNATKTITYIYDSENRLTSLLENGVTKIGYKYDGDGGRVQKTIYGPTTQVINYFGQLFETDSARSTDHIFLGNMRIAAVTNGTVSFTHNDYLSSANVVTDATGAIKEITEYDPFGAISRQDKYGTGPEVAWFYFNGKDLDKAYNLYYYGGRYYDCKLGKFLTPDVLIQNPYDPQALNRYSYTGNNPTNRVDHFGHKWSWSHFWKAFAGVFIGTVVTILTGGAGIPLAGAMFWGGLVGGAITGGLEGGWKGMLLGAATGAVMGRLGGMGIEHFGAGFGIGMTIAGAGLAAATNTLDSFAGGITGGLTANMIVKSFVSMNHKVSFNSDDEGFKKSDGKSKIAVIVDKGKGASGDPLIDDPDVRAQMLQALNDSFQNGTEEGGFIKGTPSDKFMVSRWPQQNCSSDQCIAGSFQLGVKGAFHTHVHINGPGESDFKGATDWMFKDIKNYVVDPSGIKVFESARSAGLGFTGPVDQIWRWDGYGVASQ